ncbi:MAG: hypothetical protein J5717_13585 [Lachnospiraceae bacterium]|nr:hypothetical protein [Lachnospiraceae bacterium]
MLYILFTRIKQEITVFVYSIGRTRTKSYKTTYNEPCDCLYCQNFREAYPKFCPHGNALLENFGLSVDSALEVAEEGCETGESVNYTAYFCVSGTLTTDGYNVAVRDTSEIKLFMSSTEEPVYNNTDMEEPYYILRLEVNLPWVLESKPEPVST